MCRWWLICELHIENELFSCASSNQKGDDAPMSWSPVISIGYRWWRRCALTAEVISARATALLPPRAWKLAKAWSSDP
jgi:hypothetical protein